MPLVIPQPGHSHSNIVLKRQGISIIDKVFSGKYE
jgi:hypothetical protein